MKRSSIAHINCSIAQTLDVVGEWWTLLVVRDIMLGHRRFEAIQADLGIARNILTDRLNTLVENGIVDRIRYQVSPDRYEYQLTRRGKDLFPVMIALMNWGDRWIPMPSGQPIRAIHTGCGGDIETRMICMSCGEHVADKAAHAIAGPGATVGKGTAVVARFIERAVD